MNAPLIDIEIPELELIAKGKVRNIYDFGGDVLVVTTDRLSVFDRPLGVGIADRGKVLTGMTAFWFEEFSDLIENYMISTGIPAGLERYSHLLAGRTMLTKRVSFLPVECVVRGYLYGSAWRDYLETGEVCGLKLKPGMQLGENLLEPVFTPARKVKDGHDVNITEGEYLSIVGEEQGGRLKDVCLSVYQRASSYLESRGLILADTKMEFGLLDGSEVLVNELLTPDCSRFWLKERYALGRAQGSMDKQPLRDYLESKGWTGEGPVPDVPEDVLSRISRDYRAVYRMVMRRDV